MIFEKDLKVQNIYLRIQRRKKFGYHKKTIPLSTIFSFSPNHEIGYTYLPQIVQDVKVRISWWLPCRELSKSVQDLKRTKDISFNHYVG